MYDKLEIYKGKTVLITGSSGFKGSWMALVLLRLGAKVAGYSLEPPTHPSLFEDTGLVKNINQYFSDIRDRDKMKNCVAETKPDFIFHLAAQPLVRESYYTPVETFDTNIMGTVNLLDVVRELNLETTVVCITSDKAYENKEWLFGYREVDPLGGFDPYSASKGAAEIVIESYRNSFFHIDKFRKDHHVKLASVRAGNVIGGGDWAKDRIVPDCIRHLMKKESVLVRNPKATRPWQHVLEPVVGYLLLGAFLSLSNSAPDLKKYCSAFNFGPMVTSNKNVESLVNEILKNWGSGDWFHQKTNSPHEASLLSLTIEKAYHLLSWQPVWDFQRTIKETTEWYQTYYLDKTQIPLFTEKQVLLYLNDIS